MGRESLEQERDIINFMQQIRLLHKKVDFKIKLNYEEKTLVENNRFLKLQREDSGSDEVYKSNTSFNSGKYKTNE